MRLQSVLAPLLGAASLTLASAAKAAIIFSYGAVSSLGSNNFSVPLLVRSDTALQVRGADLIQIIGGSSSTTTPTFNNVDLKPAGGLFGGVSDPVVTPSGGTSPQAYERTITLFGSTPFVTIPTSSTLLANVTFNAAGLVGKTFTLSNNFGGNSSTFTPYPTGTAVNVNNLTATITIPEPATLAAVACAGLALVARRRRPDAA